MMYTTDEEEKMKSMSNIVILVVMSLLGCSESSASPPPFSAHAILAVADGYEKDGWRAIGTEACPSEKSHIPVLMHDATRPDRCLVLYDLPLPVSMHRLASNTEEIWQPVGFVESHGGAAYQLKRSDGALVVFATPDTLAHVLQS